MIQRIQSIYLLIVFIINGLLPFWIHPWTDLQRKLWYEMPNILYFLAFLGSGVLALFTLFMYKNRKNQFVLNRLNIILNFIILIFFVYHSLNSFRDNAFSQENTGAIFPMFAIIFLALANKAIKKDEGIIKSMDRLR